MNVLHMRCCRAESLWTFRLRICAKVTKVRERLAVSKQTAQNFDGERFNLTKLNELDVRKQNQIEISNRFVALENLNDSEDINRVWENIQDNIKISAKVALGLTDWKQHEPWFDEESLGFLDQRKQVKIQWLQDPSQSNVGNLNNVRRYASRHCRNKTKEYPKAKNDELDTKSKVKNIRKLYIRICKFKKGYHPRTNTVKDEKGDKFTDSHSILVRWRNHFT